MLGGAFWGLYWYFFAGAKKEISVLNYIKRNAVFYHPVGSDIKQYIGIHSGQGPEKLYVFQAISDSNNFDLQVNPHNAFISWHMDRQKKLNPFVWIWLGQNIDIYDQIKRNHQPAGELIEVMLDDGAKLYLYKSGRYVVASHNGELLQTLSGKAYLNYDQKVVPTEHTVAGNFQLFQQFLRHYSAAFAPLQLPGTTFQLRFYPSSTTIHYNFSVDSLPVQCADFSHVFQNNTIPRSAVAAWHYNLGDVQCTYQNIQNNLKDTLWNTEERYQFNLSSLLDAWFGGSFTRMYCNFNGVHAQVAMVKLKHDAAPFGSGTRFLTDYETVKTNRNNSDDNYTIARFIPDAMAQVIFSRAQQTRKLYVTQFRDMLYFSPQKKALVLLLNELINQKTMPGFYLNEKAIGGYFFRFPEIISYNQKNHNHMIKPEQNDDQHWVVTGKVIRFRNGIHCQGSIIIRKKD